MTRQTQQGSHRNARTLAGWSGRLALQLSEDAAHRFADQDVIVDDEMLSIAHQAAP
jgi:hypothetical protein